MEVMKTEINQVLSLGWEENSTPPILFLTWDSPAEPEDWAIRVVPDSDKSTKQI